MNFLSRIVRYLFWVLVVASVVRFFRWWLGELSGVNRRTPGPRETPFPQAAARRLVRDPVCGMYVAEVLAIPLKEASGTVHFCSGQCRDKYAAALGRYAANG
jgi:hypothetical protein